MSSTPTQPDAAPARLALALALTGVAAGVIGVAMAWFVHGVEWLAFGYDVSNSVQGVGRVPRWRRLVAPAVGGLIAGLLWWRLRPRPKGSLPSVKEALTGRSLHWRTHLDAVTQLIVVATGASIGREAAPRQSAAAVAQQVARRLALPAPAQRTLIAAAAGAGLAAVYNVPATGVLMSVEMMLHSDLRTRAGWWQVGQCAIVSAIATLICWVGLGNRPTYELPHVQLTSTQLGLALLAAIATSLIADVFGSALRWARKQAPATRWLPGSVMVGSLLVGALACWVPTVVGNGKPMVQLILLDPLPVATLVMLMLVKTVATMTSLASGAAGGQLTPALAIGAATGAIVAAGFGVTGLGALAPVALVGAACTLTVTQHAPLFAAAFGAELTHPPAPIAGLLLASVLVAWLLHLGRHRATDDWLPAWRRR